MPDLTPPDEPIADDHLERLLMDAEAPAVPLAVLVAALHDPEAPLDRGSRIPGLLGSITDAALHDVLAALAARRWVALLADGPFVRLLYATEDRLPRLVARRTLLTLVFEQYPDIDQAVLDALGIVIFPDGYLAVPLSALADDEVPFRG